MFRMQPVQNPARARKAQVVSFPAPTAGWISNRNLAQPNQPGAPQGAEILENFFPTATGAIIRRGRRTYAQLGTGSSPTTALFKYVVGNNRRLFAANENTVYDITAVTIPTNYALVDENGDLISSEEGQPVGENSTLGLEVLTGATGGNWSVEQFATSGGVYLVGVNGQSAGFYFDGTSFTSAEGGTVEITFPAGSGLTTADISFVWAFKNRLWFIQKESLSAWYLEVGQIGGELTEFPLGGVFGQGGSLLFGQTWSLEGGAEGGLSEQIVFVTTEGEVAVYQGTDPAQAADWRKVGVYRIGKPLGQQAFIRAGGDLIIATNIGFIALSQAIQVDMAALAPRAVSYPIEVAWNEAVERRGYGWHCLLWPEEQMVAVAPPTLMGGEPVMFAANARTGAWCPFTNWLATCMETFEGRMFFGSTEGYVIEAMVGGSDDGTPYTGTYLPLFSDAGTPNSRKAARLARLTVRSSVAINERLSCRFDFDKKLPAPPDAAPVQIGNEWDNAIWNQSQWSAARDTVVTQRRHSVSGTGYRIAPALQITSGATVPLDAEIVALDVTYDVGDIFT